MMYRHLLASGCAPDDWRRDNVMPVFKEGDREGKAGLLAIFFTYIALKYFSVGTLEPQSEKSVERRLIESLTVGQ